MSVRLRGLAAGALAALALPALAYLLPAGAVLRHLGQRRAALELGALEVTGTLQAEGPAAERLAAALGRTPGGAVTAPARLLLKVPGRCRLEVGGEGEAAFVTLREGKLSGRGGLESDPSAAALVRGLCTLLATPTVGDAASSYAGAISRRGVALGEESLGRFDGRIAYVIGGRAHDAKPLVFVDKDGFQPLRLIAAEGGVLQDLRLLGWGSPTGGDWFPRAAEVVQADRLRLRFTTERATANPKLPDAAF